MVIATTYEDGNIDKHFGHAKKFKLYEIEDGAVSDSAVVSNYGSGGHEAACMLMDDYNVAVVICDNIGQSAIEGLQDMSISVIPGTVGSCDDAVDRFLSGALVLEAKGATCGGCGDSSDMPCCSAADCGGCSGCG